MSDKIKHKGYWMGEPIENKTRDELIEIVMQMGLMLQDEREKHHHELNLLQEIRETRAGRNVGFFAWVSDVLGLR